MIESIKEIVTANFSAFTINNLLAVFKNILTVEEQLKLPSTDATFECIISNFMKGTFLKNEEIKLFRFFDSGVTEYCKVTKAEETFLKQYACMNGQTIENKNTGCFALS